MLCQVILCPRLVALGKPIESNASMVHTDHLIYYIVLDIYEIVVLIVIVIILLV